MDRKAKKIGMAVIAACSAAVALSFSACNKSSDLEPGEYSVDASLSCYVTAMGGIEFGSPVYESATVSVTEDSQFITIYLTYGDLTIYSISCSVFVDANPGAEGSSRGVEDGTIGYYNDEGELVTDGVTYTLSGADDLVQKGDEVYVQYVTSITFPITSQKDKYNLTLYINSDYMGMQFCEANDLATTSTYSACLSVDWSSVQLIEE